MLLHLPSELLDSVLDYLDTSSFALLLQVNKRLRQKVLLGDALHRQYRALPHLHVCGSICKAGGQPLLREFHKRAAAECLNGIAVTCNTTTYKPSFRRHKHCQLERFPDNHAPTKLAAVLDMVANQVHVYSLSHGFPIGKFLVDPSALNPEFTTQDIVLLRLHVQDNQNHITLLLRQSDRPDTPSDFRWSQNNSLTWEAQQNPYQQFTALTCSLSPSNGVDIVTVKDISVGKRYSAVSMETGANSDIVLVFKHDFHKMYQIKVLRTFTNNVIYDPCPIIESVAAGPGISQRKDVNKDHVLVLHHFIHSVSLSGNRHLWLYAAADQQPIYLIKDCFSLNPTIELIHQPVLSHGEPFFGECRWSPLSSVHKHRTKSEVDGSDICISSVLQLAFIKCTFRRGEKYKMTECLLIKSHSCVSTGCYKIDLENPFPSLEHEVVAVLDGVDMSTPISQGRVVAINKARSTVAIATWDRVLLFNINPAAFLEPRTGSLTLRDCPKTKFTKRKTSIYANSAREFGDESEASYSKHCGQGYYRNYTNFFGKRVVRLTPIELPVRGVVTKMQFLSKTALWAWTDRGLVKWDWSPAQSGTELRPTRTGRRENASLIPVCSGSSGILGPVPKGWNLESKSRCRSIDTIADDMDWSEGSTISIVSSQQ